MKILERILHYSSARGNIEIPISIDLPVQGDRDWSCLYRIDWPDGLYTGSGYGLDATQALQCLALAEQDAEFGGAPGADHD